ncbi:MAG: ROK family protein [Kiritimatiellae bacterium]|nr:ROK family protein [Kiritimatiellia bacterium]
MANNGKDRKFWIGFDLGGTKMMAIVFDKNFKASARNRKKTKGHEGSKAGLDRIVRTIQGALDEAKLSVKDLAGIGVGCPGPLDLNRGVIIDAPNLGWQNVPLQSTLEKAFGCPAVIANDVDAGVYGEYCFGAGQKARCVLGVFPGTGIGGGCIYEGRILRGTTSSCLEIGHIPVMPDGPLCGCGRRGCLEAVASRLAISAAAAAAAFRGDAPHLLEEAGTDLSEIRSGALAAAIQAGDEAIENIVRDAARWLGVGIAAAVNLLAPDVLVLGGGLVEAMPRLYVEEVEKSLKKHAMPSFAKSLKVATARLGDDATATGAAAWARDSIGKIP